MESHKKSLVVGSVLLVVLVGALVLWQKPQHSFSASPAPSDKPVAAKFAAGWIEKITTGNLEEGVRLARERGEMMRELIRTNPEQAIFESLSLSEWAALPPEIQKHVEQPFSTIADVDVMIACGKGISETFITTKLPTIGRVETFVYGHRKEIGSKTGIPVQGIRVGNVGVLREDTFQPLETADEAAAIKRYPVAIEDPGGDSAAALAGGKLFYFKSRAVLAEANSRLAALQELPGPDAGAQALFQSLEAYILAEGEIDFQALEDAAYAAATAWTGTPRDMYVIMVDFPDLTGQPADPGAFSNSLNTAVSQQIWEMSYEKTHIVATVNPKLYHLASPSTNFSNNVEPLHAEAVALVGADGVDLSPFETVCVIFPRIPSLGNIAGIADNGASRLWLNGSTDEDVVIHELGHNYGSSHASFWDVSGSNPVDPAGSRLEYGDFTDIMGSGDAPEGHFNAWHKKKIGWFETNNWLSVTNSKTYRIYRSDHRQTTGLLRGLEIDKNGSDQYWVGLRQEYPSYETFSRGAYLLWKQTGTSRSHLLDTSPLSVAAGYDGGLALGQTYSDTSAGVHITPTARGGQTPNEWMDITVNLGSFPGNTAPTASIIGPTNGMTRTSISFEINASDPDGDELAYFWDFGDGLVKDNHPMMPHVWMTSEAGTGTVRCVVSDMKGGTTTVEHTLSFSELLGASWPYQNVIPGASHLLDIATDGDLLVAVGWQGFVGTSTNGMDWISGSVDSTGGPIYLEGLIHDGSQYIAVGTGSDGDWLQVVYTSPDAVTWTRRYFSRGLALRDAASANGIRVAVGTSGVVLRSTNGQNWNKINAGISADLWSISHAGQLFTAIGKSGSSDVIYVSVDGLTWHDRSSGAGTVNPQRLEDLKYCNHLLLAGGTGAGIRYSNTGGESFATTDATGYKIPAFAYGNGVYFAAGVNGTTDINLISADGIDWLVLPTAAQEDRNAAAFFKNRFITVGFNGSVWASDELGSGESGWALWQYLNQTELGLNRGAEDDPDGDGYLNLVEYALGTTASDAGSVPLKERLIADGDYFQVSYERKGIKPDIDYVAERATNLASNDWNSANVFTLEESVSNLTVRSAFTIASQTNEFMRLNLELK